DARDPAYWARHLRSTVRFSDGLRKILEMDGVVLLEVGPGQTLTSLARRHARAGHPAPAVFATTRRADDRSTDKTILEALGGLWTAGLDFDWRRVEMGGDGHRLPLPTYPFQRERFWLDAASPGLERRDLSEWFEVPSWERLPAAAGVAVDAASRTLRVVFVDRDGFGGDLCARLEQLGHDVVLVRAAEEYACSDRVYHVKPAAPDPYKRLFATLSGVGHERCDIVHCWSVDADARVEDSASGLAAFED